MSKEKGIRIQVHLKEKGMIASAATLLPAEQGELPFSTQSGVEGYDASVVWAIGDLTVPKPHWMVQEAGKSREDMLLEFSEWLDGQGLVVGDNATSHIDASPRKDPGEDKRSHQQLVEDFLKERSS